MVIAVICEYNPFHKGHEYHLASIRREFGEDTGIVAIMSGNYTQRAELAILPKSYRAKTAVECGADLVLELPFPYSASSAELFASAGVHIADMLGCVDVISFGTESGNLDDLYEAEEIIDSDEYKRAFSSIPESKFLGYPERCEAAFRAVSGSGFDFTPNNILAVEYLRALRSRGSRIKPHTIKREGSGYNDGTVNTEAFSSAKAIRTSIIENGLSSINDSLPEATRKELALALELGDFPTDERRLDTSVITKFRLSPRMQNVSYHDASDGLYNRLRSASFEANDISSLLLQSHAKNYTKARIRRAMWNVFFGVTSSDVKRAPCFTQVLAMNKRGMQILKSVKKRDDFFILTKPSGTKVLTESALKQKQLSDIADSVFELSKPVAKSGNSSYRFTPYIKK